jgi:2-octaprenyl-6-methoxyphenol hydroxylase
MTVCILGNGLSALTLAKALTNKNINVDILSKTPRLEFDKTRTIGITKSNVDFFNKDIIKIEKLLWKLNKIEIFSNNLKKEKLINFENDSKQLFSIIKNYELYRILEKNLSRSKYCKKKLYNDKSLSFIKKYDLVINCDISNSITKKFFSKKIVKKYNSFAYSTIIKHDNFLNNTATQIFTKKGPLAFLPISNTETSVVYSVYNSINKNIEELIKDNNFKYKINKIEKVSSFELISLNLRSYYHNNILAFGDLLHKIHPLAGQGFNMTIRDIKTLSKIIGNRLDLGLPLDSSVNAEFENRLKHKNFIFSNGVDLIHEFFNIERKTKSKILSKTIQIISKYPSINRIFTKIADRGILS